MSKKALCAQVFSRSVKGMIAIRLPLAAFTLLLATSFGQSAGFRDDFSDPKLEIRQALRGEWIFEDKVASCVSDPELYLEFKNHGPILRWPCEINDGTVEFEFKPQDCQRVVDTESCEVATRKR
ncbi:MAG: hypothetical protein OSB19_15570 [Opitutaceae bacterium]|jgi:hypothetical protein|nr:hypothetical protein [Opitutaceae bacterium]